MTTEKKVARRKLSMLELAQELGNVSKACAVMGYSRQQFCEIRRNFQTYGAQGLLDRLPGPRGPHPNREASRLTSCYPEFLLLNWSESGGKVRPPCLPSLVGTRAQGPAPLEPE